jgi:choline dehydrogenase-like flavoprotein
MTHATPWLDLRTADSSQLNVDTDVCVIGAGAAGCYLAHQLAKAGRDTLVVEAGAAQCVSADEVAFTTEFEGIPYRGATEGRAFGLGGSTARWGGLLAPHSETDVRGRDTEPYAAAWWRIADVVRHESQAVLDVLGYSQAPDFDSFPRRSLAPASCERLEPAFRIQAALFLPFRLKNLVWLLRKACSATTRCRVLQGAVSRKWSVSRTDDTGRITGVVAVSGNGREAVIRANKFIIAAGAIESARLLLELNECDAPGLLPPGVIPGRGLADHLSVTIGDVAPADRSCAARLFGPRFTGSWMHTYRFMEREPPADAPRGFAHFIFDNQDPGFELVREVLGAWQGKRMPRLTLPRIARGFAGAAALVRDRYFRARLHLPADTPVRFQLDMAQPLHPSNAIALTDRTDRYGRRIPLIRWQVTDVDQKMIVEGARRVTAEWPAGGGLPRIAPRELSIDGKKPHDAYHPVGTCRMGGDSTAIVDDTLRVRGTKNLWVASTAVLPGAGTANPTFTLLCLAHGLAAALRDDG